MLDLLTALIASPAPSPPSPTHDQAVDWPTVVVSLIVGVAGGVVGALITSATQRKLARDAASATANQALWGFQRALNDFAAEQEGAIIRDGDYFTKTTREDLEAARRLAYPHRGYLGAEYTKLVSRNWLGDWDPHGDPLRPVEDWSKWSNDLEGRLNVVFEHQAREKKKHRPTSSLS